MSRELTERGEFRRRQVDGVEIDLGHLEAESLGFLRGGKVAGLWILIDGRNYAEHGSVLEFGSNSSREEFSKNRGWG